MTRRVLIADDDPIVRQDLQFTLTTLGYHVVGAASDGASAERMARETRPDLVLIDTELAGREEPVRPLGDDAPVLVLMASNRQDAITSRRHSDVGAYLTKPVRSVALQPTIEVALARGAELRALRARVRGLEDALRTRTEVERAKSMLMEAAGLTEAEAFRLLQKRSMNTRTPLREVAVAAVAALESGLTGGGPEARTPGDACA